MLYTAAGAEGGPTPRMRETSHRASAIADPARLQPFAGRARQSDLPWGLGAPPRPGTGVTGVRGPSEDREHVVEVRENFLHTKQAKR